MPISPIVLQRRQAELGRIRLGQKQATSNGRTRPAKLDRFRFTSVSEQYIRDLADLYGGAAQPWDNGGIPSWEVVTEATSLQVIVVKGGLSQWMETWSGGGCIHRCDGQVQVDGTPCDPNDPNHVNAKPTTRLSVMLPELEAVGVFRMESHGWNAAAEIPAVAELAQYVGDLVPAVLHLVERRAIKDGKTSRFVVPVLDLQIGTARLREVVAAKAGLELESSAAPSTAPAIEAASTPPLPTQADVDACDDLDTLRAMWQHATPGLRDVIAAKAKSLEAPPAAQSDADEVVDAEIIDEQPAEASGNPVLWQQALAAAGQLGWSLDQTIEAFAERFQGVHPSSASEHALREFIGQLTTEAGAA